MTRHRSTFEPARTGRRSASVFVLTLALIALVVVVVDAVAREVGRTTVSSRTSVTVPRAVDRFTAALAAAGGGSECGPLTDGHDRAKAPGADSPRRCR